MTDLADRYGSPRPVRRALLLGAVVAVLAALGVWLAWAVWIHSTPSVESDITSFGADGPHQVHAVIVVKLDDDAKNPHCKVRAVDVAGANAGDYDFVPKDGRNEISFRTLREAETVDLVGCTADDQPNPR